MPRKSALSPRITYAEARKRFRYNHVTGVLTYRVDVPFGAWVKAGDRAGCGTRKGYRVILIDRRRYPEQDVCWLLYYGKWPDSILDHRNRVKWDNRIKNLRESNGSQNQANRVMPSTRRFRGVEARPRSGTWAAIIKKDRIVHDLGRFPTEEAAARAYNRKAREFWGEFAILNDVPRRKQVSK